MTHVLYYAPQVCSFGPHVALRELGIPFDLVRVDLRTHTTAGGEPLSNINRKDYVPALVLPDGALLTEVSAILLYLADLHPDAKLAPSSGLARVRFHELLNFIATEFHKAFSVFTIMANPSEDSRAWAKARLGRRTDVLDNLLGDRPFFAGDTPTVADFYAYWALTTYVRLTRAELPARLRDFVERVAVRPSVVAAHAAEKA